MGEACGNKKAVDYIQEEKKSCPNGREGGFMEGSREKQSWRAKLVLDHGGLKATYPISKLEY